MLLALALHLPPVAIFIAHAVQSVGHPQGIDLYEMGCCPHFKQELPPVMRHACSRAEDSSARPFLLLLCA